MARRGHAFLQVSQLASSSAAARAIETRNSEGDVSFAAPEWAVSFACHDETVRSHSSCARSRSHRLNNSSTDCGDNPRATRSSSGSAFLVLGSRRVGMSTIANPAGERNLNGCGEPQVAIDVMQCCRAHSGARRVEWSTAQRDAAHSVHAQASATRRGVRREGRAGGFQSPRARLVSQSSVIPDRRFPERAPGFFVCAVDHRFQAPIARHLCVVPSSLHVCNPRPLQGLHQ